MDDMEYIKDELAEIKTTSKDTLTILTGKDSNGGLITEVQLNKQSTKRLWWFVGALTLSILGSAVYVVRNSIA